MKAGDRFDLQTYDHDQRCSDFGEPVVLHHGTSMSSVLPVTIHMTAMDEYNQNHAMLPSYAKGPIASQEGRFRVPVVSFLQDKEHALATYGGHLPPIALGYGQWQGPPLKACFTFTCEKLCVVLLWQAGLHSISTSRRT